MVRLGVDVNKAIDNEDGATPLCIASQNGHLEIVKVLIAAGADVNQATKNGCTPLYVASLYGHLEVIKVLIASGLSLIHI